LGESEDREGRCCKFRKSDEKTVGSERGQALIPPETLQVHAVSLGSSHVRFQSAVSRALRRVSEDRLGHNWKIEMQSASSIEHIYI